MAEVMDAETLESAAPRYRAPRALQVGAWFLSFRARIVASDYIVADALQIAEHLDRDSIGHNGLSTGLAIGQEQHSTFEIDLIPS